MIISDIRDWLNFIAEVGILIYVMKEYYYDYAKDEVKKQRRTRTTKKVTTEPDGTIVTQENIESIENKGESNAQ